jgi:hypothetical protein
LCTDEPARPCRGSSTPLHFYFDALGEDIPADVSDHLTKMDADTAGSEEAMMYHEHDKAEYPYDKIMKHREMPDTSTVSISRHSLP